LGKYTKHCFKKPNDTFQQEIFKKQKHQSDSMCQLSPKKANVEMKKPKSQTFFLTPTASKKRQISQIWRKKANLATLACTESARSEFYLASSQGH